MHSNLKLVINNPHKQIEQRQFFDKEELKTILDLYAKWFLKDLGEIMV